jgi:hypothetical protein
MPPTATAGADDPKKASNRINLGAQRSQNIEGKPWFLA